MKNNYNLIVVGGGAAGMLAAGFAGSRGLQVLLLEKNEMLGKKILITGKGRCNITNAGEIEDLIKAFGKKGKFMYSAFYSYTNDQVIQFFHELGVKTKTERGKRVFPVSDKSQDVVAALKKYLQMNNVEIKLNSSVSKLIKGSNSEVAGVRLKDGTDIKAKAVLIATGGASYPKTGSTGDGYKLADQVGHSIAEPRPALVPLVAKETWIKDLQGLALKNVELSVVDNKKVLSRDFGEMIFTHFGISGPIVLTLSKQVGELISKNKKPVRLQLNLKPALTDEQLDKRITRDFEEFSKKQFKNSLDKLLPKSLIPVIIAVSGINPEKHVNQITREERRMLTKAITQLPLTVTGTRPLEEAIVTAGGVNIKEIDPRTMESHLIKKLYFAGEVLDIDGITGGYNLQAAFSTGYLAAQSIVEETLSS